MPIWRGCVLDFPLLAVNPVIRWLLLHLRQVAVEVQVLRWQLLQVGVRT
jgi:hypothetical protein